MIRIEDEMRMALYHFVTEFEVAVPAERVWDVLESPSAWPAWWHWLRSVEVLEPGKLAGEGARYRLTFDTAMRFALTFDSEVVQFVRPSLSESLATGDLAGTGRWGLSEQDGRSRVRHTWIVAPTKRWMRSLAPIARPAFCRNHAVLMRDFATGLAGEVGARLISVENRAISPRAADFGRLPNPVAP